MDELPNYPTVAQGVRDLAASLGERRAMSYRGVVTTYKEMSDHATSLAQALISAGVGSGDRIGILGKNSDRFMECVFAGITAGAVVTPLNWRLAPDEITYMVNDSEIDFIFYDTDLRPLLRGVENRSQVTLIAIDSDEYIQFRDTAAALPLPDTKRDDVVLQIYTSGTTGRPKGAMLTNRNLSKYFGLGGPPNPEWWQVWLDDVGLISMPMFHIGGLETALKILLSGGSIVIVREFNPAEVLEAVAEHRVTLLALVPTALQMLLNAPGAGDVDFSCIRAFHYGASPIPAELLRQGLRVMKCSFAQCYGMSETTSTVVALGPEDHSPEGGPRMKSTGKPLPYTEVRVVDQDGNDRAVGEVGEILIRAPSVMVGYWKRPEETQAAIEPDGWLHTGDAGYLDEDGFLYVHDRVKDMIVSGGENVYPAEVESAIFGHPDVSEVAVIGVPDPVWGEAVKAIIVLKQGSRFDPQSISNWARDRIASYKVPKSIDLADALPKNASGKLLKTELRKPYWAGFVRGVN
jgi:long-chain acyl-CoA synthetase